MRNGGPILECLMGLTIPNTLNHALEVGVGLGSHLAPNSAAIPDLTWHPTDMDIAGVKCEALSEPNVRVPTELEVSAEYLGWPEAVR